METFKLPGEDFLFGVFRLDPAMQQLWRGSGLVPLRLKLFAALRYLVENPGRLITREELRLDAAYDLAKYSEAVTKDVASYEEMNKQGTGAIRRMK